jgi:phosphoenolpyruvate carboxylase
MGILNMLGNVMGGSLFNHKSARVADQVDAEAKAGLLAMQNLRSTVQQFKFVETQLGQFTQMFSQQEPTIAMQFQNMQSQIANITQQLENGVTAGENHFRAVDSITDKIQG